MVKKRIIAIAGALFCLGLTVVAGMGISGKEIKEIDGDIQCDQLNISIQSMDVANEYAYMDIDEAPANLHDTILEARDYIIYHSTWVADGYGGSITSPEGEVLEIVPEFHDIFPEDWEIPVDKSVLK